VCSEAGASEQDMTLRKNLRDWRRTKIRQRNWSRPNHVFVFVINSECRQDRREQIPGTRFTFHNLVTFRVCFSAWFKMRFQSRNGGA